MSWILFFDSGCVMCGWTARMVLRADVGGLIDFAPIEGELAKDLGLERFAKSTGGSMVLLDEKHGQRFVRSDAALQLAVLLGWPWRMLALLRVVPMGLRDAIYQWVADHRHQWFKPSDACRMADPEVRNRMRN